jgi:hypothetical protein
VQLKLERRWTICVHGLNPKCYDGQKPLKEYDWVIEGGRGCSDTYQVAIDPRDSNQRLTALEYMAEEFPISLTSSSNSPADRRARTSKISHFERSAGSTGRFSTSVAQPFQCRREFHDPLENFIGGISMAWRLISLQHCNTLPNSEPSTLHSRELNMGKPKDSLRLPIAVPWGSTQGAAKLKACK